MRGMFGERDAQATVEMAIVLPVLLVVALIVYNLMLFASATASFDHVVGDIVIAHAVAPAGGSPSDASATVERYLDEAMEGYGVEVSVSCEAGSDDTGASLTLVGALATYRCELRFTPWPSALSIAGVSWGAPFELVHERSVTIDPWRPGVVL